MKTLKIGVSLVAIAVISACTDSTNYDFDGARQEAEDAASLLPSTTFEASFSPAGSIIPFPNNILMSESVDGTINIPVDDPEDYSNPQVALNALDGFSTISPITTGFSQAVAPDSVTLGETVRVFEVTSDPATGAVTGLVAELTKAQIAADIIGEDQRTLALIPIVPLTESTTYLVVLTNGIQNTAEPAAIADKSVSYYLTSGDAELTGPAAALEPLRQLTGSYEAVASAAGVIENNIVLSWSFTTQSITPVLDSIASNAAAGNIVVNPQGLPSSQLIPQLTDAANIHFGALTVPYYQTAPTADNPQAGINGFFRTADGGFVTRFAPTPAKTGDQTIPLILTVPAGTAPATGWPVVIFQHGITQDRTNVLALADSMAAAGLALAAIDLPMHGVTDTKNTLNAESDQLAALGAKERTFGLDLAANNDTGAAGPDGIPDTSGTHFYNLTNLLNARDNLRQAVSDLLTLERSLANIQGINLNTDNIGFIGHSLGGIIGTTYLAYSDEVGPATLAMPGVGLSRLLANSPAFGPTINAGLADQGAPEGSVAYETFLTAAQTVIDSGDPVNFAATAASLHPIHLLEVVGGSAGSLPDQVIPNQVATAPLSGTEPMARLMNLDPVTATAGNGSADVSGIVRFIAGDHGSILNPTNDLNTTIEMQTQTANFMASGGRLIKITDTDVISTGN